jgi:hypothetical protein
VGREGKSLAAEGFDFGYRCLQILRFATGYNHFGPTFGETKCYRLADATTAAGNDSDFSFQ